MTGLHVDRRSPSVVWRAIGLLGAASALVAIGLVSLTTSTASADTVSSAPDCVPVQAVPAWTEIHYKYTPVKNGTGSTYWSASNTDSRITVNGSATPHLAC